MFLSFHRCLGSALHIPLDLAAQGSQPENFSAALDPDYGSSVLLYQLTVDRYLHATEPELAAYFPYGTVQSPHVRQPAVRGDEPAGPGFGTSLLAYECDAFQARQGLADPGPSGHEAVRAVGVNTHGHRTHTTGWFR